MHRTSTSRTLHISNCVIWNEFVSSGFSSPSLSLLSLSSSSSVSRQALDALSLVNKSPLNRRMHVTHVPNGAEALPERWVSATPLPLSIIPTNNIISHLLRGERHEFPKLRQYRIPSEGERKGNEGIIGCKARCVCVCECYVERKFGSNKCSCAFALLWSVCRCVLVCLCTTNYHITTDVFYVLRATQFICFDGI